MNKTRLEAFSDGVIAIIITIMVLELRAPKISNYEVLLQLSPQFESYVLSFIYLGIYWNNHHHLMHTVKKITPAILWCNLLLLFWLSLIPFATAWLGNTNFSSLTVLFYGVVLLLNGVAYFILQNVIIKSHGAKSELKKAIGKDIKGKMSVVLYIVSICFSYIAPMISGIIFVVVAIMWFIPDKRIAKLYDN